MVNSADDILKDIIRAERPLPEDEQDEPEEPEEPELDFGLYYPLAYVITTWNEHRQHNNLPRAGGWNDQDPRLVEHDWRVIGERYGYLYQTFDNWKFDPPLTRSDTSEPLDFMDLFGS